MVCYFCTSVIDYWNAHLKIL